MTIPEGSDTKRDAELRIVVRLDPGETCIGLAALLRDVVGGMSTRCPKMVGLSVTPVIR